MLTLNFMLKKAWLTFQNEEFSSVLIRVLVKTQRLVSERIQELLAGQFGSYSLIESKGLMTVTLRLDLEALKTCALGSCLPESVAQHYLNHYFDLLGSGWTQVRYGAKCRGLAGYRYDMGVEIATDSAGQWLADRLNSSNQTQGIQIWNLVDSGYVPIDWQLDFKSGYRWCEKTWATRSPYGHSLGVDVKVPWELARMQHLPQLALAYAIKTQNSSTQTQIKSNKPKESLIDKTQNNHCQEKFLKYACEFRNQVLDFIATNPPRFGVNWACAMDVAIRAANWLVAYDIYHSAKADFDDEFKKAFTSSIYEHGLCIVKNLEWDNRARGNHYLANIAGLTFISTYLPSTKQTDAWLAFSIQELITEVEHQFYPDGGNFEGSTSYHRLSAEMVYYATALVLGLPQERLNKLQDYDCTVLKTGWRKPKLKPAPIAFYKFPSGTKAKIKASPFPQWYFERMERMAEFIIDITKPNGCIPQIGDNDSGRFLNLNPRYQVMTVKQAKEKYANLEGYTELPDDEDYYGEDHLNCSNLVALACSMFGREDFARFLGRRITIPEYCLIGLLAGGAVIGTQRLNDALEQNNKFFTTGMLNDIQKFNLAMQEKKQVRITEFVSLQGGVNKDLKLRAYPDFGLYLFKSTNIFLAVRCWTGRAPFRTGHMHNDNLSFELVMNGKECIVDPGTYLYTPLPSYRNQYRSIKSHFTPFMDDNDLSPLDSGLFKMPDPKRAQVLRFSHDGFQAELISKGRLYGITCCINVESLIVYHYLSPTEKEEPWGSPDCPPYSRGYGIVEVGDILVASKNNNDNGPFSSRKFFI
jgi:hypothetical protein